MLVVIESLQFKYYGMAEYFTDTWNYFDISHFSIYVVYFIFRVVFGHTYYLLPIKGIDGVLNDMNEQEQILKIKEIQANSYSEMLWVFIHSAMLVLITFKLMFFMRVSENFSSLVKLINNVIAQVGPFTIFFTMWMITMCLLFRVSGITLIEGSDDYPEVNGYFALFMQNFRNSIGDISTPQHSYWFPTTIKGLSKGAQALETDATSVQTIMAYWGWVLFLFNEFFILIVLLNFLIAIIGQSYDEVMSKEEIDRYNSRCALNIEVAIILDTIASWTTT
jgi:predicted membrane protein